MKNLILGSLFVFQIASVGYFYTEIDKNTQNVASLSKSTSVIIDAFDNINQAFKAQNKYNRIILDHLKYLTVELNNLKESNNGN